MLILNKNHKSLHFILKNDKIVNIRPQEIKEVSDEDYNQLKTNKFIYKVNMKLDINKLKQ
jgi:hypothetical protein